MKEFMLLIRKEGAHGETRPPGREEEFLNACSIYIEKLKKDGKLISAQPLERSGKIIFGTRQKFNETPFNDRQEVIAGYYHLRVKDINEAIEIAKRNPEFDYSSNARIEVRPIKTSEETTGYEYPGGKE